MECDTVIWRTHGENILTEGHWIGAICTRRDLAKEQREHGKAKVLDLAGGGLCYCAPFTVDCRKPDQVKSLADFGSAYDDICRRNGVEVVC